MPPPRDIELKLDVDPGDVADLRANTLPRLGALEQGTSRLLSVYFDTQKQALRESGWSLRVRADGSRFIQTIKSDTLTGTGLSTRAEWETEIGGPAPSLEAAAMTPLAEILMGRRGLKPLMPVFETSVERTRWMIKTDAFAIEVALDEGQIRAGGISSPVSELELQLKHGAPAHLFDVAKRLAGSLHVTLGVRSKAERGYALLMARPSRNFKAEPVQLTSDMSAAEAFQAVMRNCIRHFRLNEPLVIEQRAAAPLHQARVAMRRLRSVLSLFKACIADDALDQISNRLRVVAGKLGEARNLDVYLARCEDDAKDGSDHRGAELLIGDIESRREQAYEELTRSLEARGFQELMLDLVAWVEAGPWLTTQQSDIAAARDAAVADFAADVLERWRRKLRKKGRRIDKLGPRARHRIRIRTKKLRYATEFFAGLVETKKGRRRHAAFLAAVVELQGRLGDLNDIATGQALAAAIVRDLEVTPRANPRALIFAAGHASGRQAAGGKTLLRSSRKAYRDFADTPRFWER